MEEQQTETVDEPTTEEVSSEETATNEQAPQPETTTDSGTETETEIETTNVSLYTTDDYTIELVHQITLGDILISTILSALLIVVLLNRLIGGSR